MTKRKMRAKVPAQEAGEVYHTGTNYEREIFFYMLQSRHMRP